jgi:pyruvate dehydrogenase E2 component (dihydrolipoamide acetyltransferase)
MARPILMPQVGQDLTEGKVVAIKVKVGDKVKKGDIVAEVESEKATFDVEAFETGTIIEVRYKVGENATVLKPLMMVGDEGEVASAAVQAAAPPAAAAAPASPPVTHATMNAPATAAAVTSLHADAGPGRSSPLARRLAREAGLDIRQIPGTGPGGSVVMKDVEAFRQSAAATATVLNFAGAARAQPPGDDQVLKLFAEGSYDLVPHDGMRKTIARRLSESKQTIPHFYVSVDVTLDQLLALRERLNTQAPKDTDGKPAWKISVNDFVIKAMAMALAKVPDANVSWTENAMVKHRHADIGVAVSIPGGLITPIVRKAETKGLAQISAEMKDYAKRAKDRKLKPEEYSGGSAAISNMGMLNVKSFGAIVNPPHASILAVGSGEERAVVRGGQVVVVQQMTITLSTDHRCIDGALGAEFINAIKGYLEEPGLMLV